MSISISKSALLLGACVWVVLAVADGSARAAEDGGPLGPLRIDLGLQRTFWEDDEITIHVPWEAEAGPRISLVLADREGDPIETIYRGGLGKGGFRKQIAARDLPPGSYWLQLEAELGGAERTVREMLIILPRRDHRTYVATGCYAHFNFDVGADGTLSQQGRGFVDAHMNTVLMTEASREGLDAAAYAGVIGHYRIGGRGYGTARPLGPDGKQASDGFYNSCFVHPDNRETARRTIGEECGRLAGHPAVYGYIIQDEMQHHARACYCPPCREAFRGWLEEKYGTIGKLNEAWSPEEALAGWDAIEPPLPLSTPGARVGAEDKSVNRYAWYDWLQFKDWSMANHITECARSIRELAPGKVVANHLIPDYFASHGFHWRDNPWVLQVHADQAQASQWGDRYSEGFHANVDSHIRKPAWVTGTNPFVGPELRTAQVYSGYMHGYQGVMWWFYHPVMEGGIDFGLLEQKPEGSRGARYERMAEVNRRIRRIAPVLGETATARAPVGLLWSDATVIQNPNNNVPVADCWGLYRALNRLQLEPVVLLDSQITAEQLKGLKAVLLGGAWDMPARTATALDEYVRDGGHIIASTGTAFYDRGHRETHALAEIFGARQGRRTRSTEQLELKRSGEARAPVTHMKFNNRSIPVIGYTQEVTVDGARVLARAESDYQPLLTRNTVGRGAAVLASFSLGKTCASEASDVGLELMEHLLAEAGVKRSIRVRSSGSRDGDVDAILRHNDVDSVWYLLAVNYGEATGKQDRVKGRFGYVYDLMAGRRVAASFEAGYTRFDVEQPRYDPQAYALVEGMKAALRYSFERQGDGFQVKINCPSGTMAMLYSRGAGGREGKRIFGVMPGDAEVEVPIYRIQAAPVELVVENRIGGGVAKW